jgi:diacylglycerol kinase (ATP)
MKVLVYYNPGAGHDRLSPEDLGSIVQRAGHDLLWCEAKADLPKALAQQPDVIVIAGGDGSVARVAKELSSPTIPLLVLPEGTANNIASSLGAGGGDLAETLSHGDKVRFDLGTISGPFGTLPFLEGVGWGAFAEAAALLNAREDQPQTVDGREDELKRDLSTFRERVINEEGSEYRLIVDGAPVAGRFLLVEVLNIPTVGPNLPFAPEANPSDGKLDLVLVDETEREELLLFAEGSLREGAELPALPIRRCSDLRVQVSEPRRWHIDGRTKEQEGELDVRVSVRKHALEFLVWRPQSVRREIG